MRAKKLLNLFFTLSLTLNVAGPALAQAAATAPAAARSFANGVLSVNTDQAYYTPGQNVWAQMGSLDSTGHTLCNSNLELDVIPPAGTMGTVVHQKIQSNASCGDDNVTNSPDYSLNFPAGAVAGEYQLVLKNLDTGLQVKNFFTVQKDLPFTVSRQTATRINPFKSSYQVKLTVTAQENFTGQLEEYAQQNFVLTNFSGATLDSAPAQDGQTFNRLTWPVSLTPGQSQSFFYTYQAPLSSPDFFEVGYAQLKLKTISQLLQNLPGDNSGQIIYAESHPWEIASDNACKSNGSGGGTFSTAGSWNSASCGSKAPGPGDSIEILNGDNITVTASTGTASTTIDLGGALGIKGSAVTFTDSSNFANFGTASGTGNITLNGNGINFDGNGTYTNTGVLTMSTTTILSTASTTVNAKVAMTAGGLTINNGIFGMASSTGFTCTTACTWTQNGGSTLNFKSTTSFNVAALTLNATSTNNTVNYNFGGTQTCKVVTYYNLYFDVSGTKTCASLVVTNVVVSGTAGWTLSAATVVSGTVTINSGATITKSSNIAPQFNSTTTIAGTLTMPSSSTGSFTFDNIVVQSGGLLTDVANVAVTINGVLEADGTGSVSVTGTTAWTFQEGDGNGVITGTSNGIVLNKATFTKNYSINASTTMTGALTVNLATLTNTSILSLGSTFTGTGTSTNAANATLRIVGGSAPAIALVAIANNNLVDYLTTGNVTVEKSQTGYYNLQVDGAHTYSASADTVSNLLTINTGATFSIGNVAFTNSATTSITGTLQIAGTTAASQSTFNQIVVNSGGIINTSGSGLAGVGVTVNGSLEVDGTGQVNVTALGTWTFNESDGNGAILGTSNNTNSFVTATFTNNYTINATTTINGIMTVTGATVTNASILTVGSALSGTGTTTQASGATLNIGGLSGIGGLVATLYPNTVNYATSVAQTVKAVPYYNLTLSGSNVETLTNVATINNNFTVSGSVRATTSTSTIIGGNLNVTTSGGLELGGGGLTFSVAATGTIGSTATFLAKATATTTFSSDLVVNGTLSGNGTGNVLANGNVTGGGTINLTGDEFLQRVSADQDFGQNSGTNTWTFKNLNFENSNSADHTITMNAGSAATITVTSLLTVGNSNDAFHTIVDDNTNDNPFITATTTITGKGSLLAPSSMPFDVSGNFINNGSFNAEGGTITFNGAATSTITALATTTFAAIYVATPSDLAFGHYTGGNLFNIGTLTASGTAGNLVTIASDQVGAQWMVNFSGAQSGIIYSFIKDGGCYTGSGVVSETGQNNTDGGNNGVCWGFFVPGITVSGSIYQTDGQTVLATFSGAMKMAVASSSGFTSYSATASGGTFKFTGVATPTVSSVLTVWLDTAAATSSSLVFRYGSGCTDASCTALTMIQNRVVIDNKDSAHGNMTISDLSGCTNNFGSACTDTDIGFIATTTPSASTTLTYASNTLYVMPGVTFAPGGSVTAQNLNVAGTYSDSNNSTFTGGTVSGDGSINMTGGTFETDGVGNFGGNNTSGWTFYNLNIGNSTLASTTAIATATTTVTNALTIGSTSSLNAGVSTFALTATGTPFVVNPGGTFTASTSKISYQATSGSITPANLNYYNLDFSPSGGTPTFNLQRSQPTFIQQAHNDAGTPGSSLGVNISTHAGNALVVYVYSQGVGESSVTDTAGDVFTEQASSTTGDIWTATNIGVSSSVTINLNSSGTPKNAVVLEYWGVGSIGKIATSTANSSNPSISLTTQDGNNVVVAGFANTDDSQSTSANQGTVRLNAYNVNQGSVQISAVDNTSATASSVTDSLTFSGSQNWLASAVELRSMPVNVSNNLTLNGPATVNANTNNIAVNISGSMTIGASATYSAASSSALTISGSFTNSGTFTHNNGSTIIQTSLTPAFVQVGSCEGGSRSCTITMSNIAGDSLFVAVGEGSSATFAVSDTKTNTYSTANPFLTGTNASQKTFLANNIAGGSNTITCDDTDGNANISCVVMEFSGGPLTLDQTATGLNNSATTNFATASTSLTSASPELAVACANNYYFSQGTMSANSPWIMASSTSAAGVMGCEYQVTTAPGQFAGQMTGSLAGLGGYAMNLATFKPAGLTTTVSTGNSALYNMTVTGNGTVMPQSTTTVAGVLNVSSGTFNAGASNIVLTGNGSPFTVSTGATFTASTSKVSYQATSGTTTPAGVNYYNLDFAPTSGTPIYSLIGGWAGINFVQSTSTILGNVSNPHAKFTSNVTKGNLIVIASESAEQTAAVTDTLGNSYARVTQRTTPDGGQTTGIWYAISASSGPDTITISNVSTFDGFVAAEYSGINPSQPLDTFATGERQSVTTTDGISSPSITTSVDGELLIGAADDDVDNSITISPGTNFSAPSTTPAGGTALILEAQVQKVHGSAAATFTSGSAHTGNAEIAAFRGISTGVANNLTLSGPATVSAYASNTPVTVGGNMTIGASATYSAAATATTTISGSFTNSGTFTHNNGTVTFDTSGSTATVNTGNSSFYNMTMSGQGTLTSQSTTSVASVLTVSSGTFNAGTSNIILTGTSTPFSVSASATFVASSSTVSYQGTATTTPAALTYNNLDFSPPSGSPTYQLGATGSSGYAVPTFINATDTSETGVLGVTSYTAGFNVNSGNLVIVNCRYYTGGSAATSTVTDSIGNSYTQLSANQLPGDANFYSFYTISSASNANDIITCHFNGASSYIDITALQYSGVTALDAVSSNIGSLSGTVTSNPISTSQTNDLVIAVAGITGSTPTFTAGTNYTLRGGVSGSDTAMEDSIATSIQSNQTATIYSNLSKVWALNFFAFKPAVSGWYNTSWPDRKQITISHNFVASSTGENYQNFPVLVSLPADANLAAAAQNGGQDILFTLSDGTTKLSHEIEHYNFATGELEAWVKMPTLSSTVDTPIYMYYGNSAVSSQQSATSTWDSNYALVEHLGAKSGVLSASDSTNNANNGTVHLNSGIGPTAYPGQIDGAASTTNANGYISVANSATLRPPTTTTVSAWVYLDNSNNGYIVVKDKSPGVSYELTSGTNGTGGDYNFCSYVSSAWTCASAPITLNQWVYVVGEYDGIKRSLFVNGTLQATTTGGSIDYTGALPLYFGGYAQANDGIDGAVDEVRVSSTTRSSDWIATEYYNQSSPSTFESVGSQQSYSGTVGYVVGGNLTTGGLGGAGNPVVDANTNNVPVSVGGSLTIGTNGTFAAASTSAFTIVGNFTNNGTFTAGGGTVTFATSTITSTIGGSTATTFYNISVTAPGKTLQFKAGQVATVANTFTVTGASGQANLVTIQSDTPASQWKAHFTIAQASFSYVIIKDSGCDAGSASVTLTGSAMDAGGNDYTCWKFITPRVDLSLVNNVTGGSGGGSQQSGGSAGGGGAGGSGLILVNSEMPSNNALHVTGQSSPWTWSFTNTSGTVLYVAIEIAASLGDLSNVSVTYGGDPMTPLGYTYANNGNSDYVALFRKLSPKTLANNVVVTFTWIGGAATLTGGAISFTGNDMSNPDGGTATTANDGGNLNGAGSITIPGTTSGNIIFADFNYGDAGGGSPSAIEIYKFDGDNSHFANNMEGQYKSSTGGSQTITYNTVSSWAAVGIEVKAAIGGAGTGGTDGGSGGGSQQGGGGSGGGGGGSP